MDWDTYTRWTRIHAIYPGALQKNAAEMTYVALGVGGETGEVLDTIKKIIRLDCEHVHNIPQEARDKLIAELGDVFWYLSRMLDCFGMPLETVLQANKIKLDKRYNLGQVKDLNHDDG